MTYRILTIDGGGIKGVFPAAFLAFLEESLGGGTIGQYFDLICGTSTGGIIALGLGLGHSAKDLQRFYETDGPAIFGGNRMLGALRHLGWAKYDTAALTAALVRRFADHLLGHSTTRLVIPSCNLETGDVHIWKTAHHERLKTDYKRTAVEVALATTAAPTFFPAHQTAAGTPLIDGGVWANNPVGVAVVEATTFLGWPAADLRVLSLGCTLRPQRAGLAAYSSLGRLYWAFRIMDLVMAAQSSGAIGTARNLLGDPRHLIRICPRVADKIPLDSVRHLRQLTGLAETEARNALPQLTPLFFATPAPAFAPVYLAPPKPCG